MESGPSHPAQRATDADREAGAELIRSAAGDGRLSVEELEQRLSAMLAARTVPEVDSLLADLRGRPPGPAHPDLPSPGRSPAETERAVERTIAVMGSASRRGVWRPAPRGRVLAVMGELELDLTRAQLGPDTELVVRAWMSSLRIIVPEGVELHVSKVGLMSSSRIDEPAHPPPPGAPRLHLWIVAGMSDVNLSVRPRERVGDLYA